MHSLSNIKKHPCFYRPKILERNFETSCFSFITRRLNCFRVALYTYIEKKNNVQEMRAPPSRALIKRKI